MTTLLSSQPGKSVDTTVGEVSVPPSRFQRVVKRAELVVLIATGAGLISSALYVLVGSKGLDLVVWFERVQSVYPSAETDGLALPLAFQNELAGAVTLIKVNVSNLGEGAIGSQETLWQLTISEPNASRLELVGKLKPSSDRISLKEIAQSTRNAYSVQLGVLERRARLEFWLMAIHDPGIRVDPDVSTTLVGLPRPDETRLSLSERLGEKLQWLMIPLWTLGFLTIAVHDLRGTLTNLREARELLKQMQEERQKQDEGGAVAEGESISDQHLTRVQNLVHDWEARDWRRSRWTMTRAFVSNGVGIILGAVMGGAFSAYLLGWMMAWFI